MDVKDMMVPPCSEAAEKGVLGSLLFDAVRVWPLCEPRGVTEDSFYFPAHRLVFCAIAELQGSGTDITTVEERLRLAGALEKTGGTAFLDQLIDDTPTAQHAEYYLDIVRQKQLLREQIGICRRHEVECHKSDNGLAMLEDVTGQLAALAGGIREEKSLEDLMNEAIADWRAAKEAGHQVGGLDTPWPDLTQLMCGLEPGLTLVGGRPGAGKSTLEDQVCCGLAANGIPVARVVLDMSPRQVMERPLCRMAGVSRSKLARGFAGERQLGQVEAMRDVLRHYPMYLTNRHRDIRDIMGWLRRMKLQHGIRLGTVDFIQQVRVGEMGRGQSDQNRKLTFVSELLKGLAFELEIPLLVLSQLTRGMTKEKRDPNLADLRDSGSLEQDASKVLMLYPDRERLTQVEERENCGQLPPRFASKFWPVWVDLQKSQNGALGRLAFWFKKHYFMLDPAESTNEEDFPLPKLVSSGGEMESVDEVEC